MEEQLRIDILRPPFQKQTRNWEHNGFDEPANDSRKRVGVEDVACMIGKTIRKTNFSKETIERTT